MLSCTCLVLVERFANVPRGRLPSVGKVLLRRISGFFRHGVSEWALIVETAVLGERDANGHCGFYFIQNGAPGVGGAVWLQRRKYK
jgi:hypothetical protein